MKWDLVKMRIYGKKQNYMALWDTVKGPPPDIKGKHPFTPYSGFTPYNGFTPGTPVFTFYTPARQGYYPPPPWKDEKESGHAIESV